MDKFCGIMPAVVAPLTEEGVVNEQLLLKHMDFLVDNGIHGLYLGGSTGEGPVMPAEERERIVELSISHVAGKGKTTIVHVGAVDTKTAVRLAMHAEKHGADAISAVPPFYYKVDVSALYQYYKALAEAVHIPLFIYNIPELTGVVVKSDDARKMAEIDNIKGIKFSSTDITEMRKMKEIKGGDFKVFFGVDQILMAGLVMGADGGIGGTYNYMPSRYVEVYENIRKNDWEKASKVQYEIARYYNICKKYGNAISCIKTILTVIHGKDMGGVISPLRNLSAIEKASLLAELKQEGLFDFIGLKTDTMCA